MSGEHTKSSEQLLAQSQETLSPYAGIEHTELIGMFYESKGNPDIGRELSVRLFTHAGGIDDVENTPLLRRDGTQVFDENTPLVLADYVNFAVKHHFNAVESILSFLMMSPGEPDYEAMKETVQEWMGVAKV